MSSDSPVPNVTSAICLANRSEAGERLADVILQESRLFSSLPSFTVYALPRGGLAVAAPIARRLNCWMDVVVAKKITRPENPELAIGSVTADGQMLWLSPARSLQEATLYEAALQQAHDRASQQWRQFVSNRPSVDPEGTIALVVDDGVATGMTMAVAVQSLRLQHPAQVWICVPVAPPEIVPHLQSWADRVIVLATPNPFFSVSRFYKEFNQVEMDEAIECLRQVNQKREVRGEELESAED